MNIGLFFAVFLLLLLFKASVAFAMLLSSIIYMFVNDLSLTLISQRMVAGANSFVLLAIPFFILASNIMNSGGITDRIFGFANKAVGHIPGGLGHANVLASIIFAGMSGSAVADAAGLGKIEIKAMTDAGYDEDFSVAITGASSIIGPIIPPSIPAVLYGVAASVSIGKLFVAGLFPGILMGICLSIMILYKCRKNNYPKESWSGFRVLFRSLGKSFFSLLTPMIILGAILTGIVTPTEAAVLAILYSGILALVYREMSVHQLKKILVESINTTVPIMSILCAAQAFGWVLANEQIPQKILGIFSEYIHSPILALLIVNVFLLLIGCFMEAGAAIIILVPVLVPIMAQFGVDPVHFGIIMILNLMIGLITPPVGVVLYVLQSISSLSFPRIVKAIMPYLFALLIALVIITFVPSLVMFLPNLIYGG